MRCATQAAYTRLGIITNLMHVYDNIRENHRLGGFDVLNLGINLLVVVIYALN